MAAIIITINSSVLWYTTATDLILLEPLFEQLFASLLEYGAAQLERLVLVELALVKEDAEVLEEWRCLPRLGWHLLEPLDSLWCPQYSLETNHTRHIRIQSVLKHGPSYPIVMINHLKYWNLNWNHKLSLNSFNPYLIIFILKAYRG